MQIKNATIKNLTVISSIQQPVVTDNLVLHLRASSYAGSGTTWDALAGTDANLYNSPAYTSTSPAHLAFNQANQNYADIATLGDLNTFTVEAWFRADKTLSSMGSFSGLPTLLCTVYDDRTIDQNTGRVNFAFTSYSGGGNNTNAMNVGFFDGSWHMAGGVAITPNTWYHVAGTYNGTALKMYTNSTLNTTISVTATPAANNGKVRIARRWDGIQTTVDGYDPTLNYFSGDIGEVRIYNRALTADEVAQNFTARSGTYGI